MINLLLNIIFGAVKLLRKFDNWFTNKFGDSLKNANKIEWEQYEIHGKKHWRKIENNAKEKK